MNSCQSYIAYLLLVLFCRVLTPEVAILALHEHEHTEDKPTSEVTIGKAHVHCDVDGYSNSEFALHTFSSELVLAPKSGHYIHPYSFAWKFTFPNNTYLRGPPLA
ncbi:hypothetical protein DXT99_07955 [Pontibacter diazotrophicus]|uniref:Uncharacterized protein n=1 Tax=Pontibacter diazotrophicus TaxID=1400979 RepID=A0A3D8LEX1_9BACT|nr:hypothetical protein [Pontibacter diazotrophicus]RDV15913.1 hypothetical protein DXT99_07955 [Pontibacter diazotrophicus]